MDSHDVGTVQHRRNQRRKRAIQPLADRNIHAVLRERPSDERFARRSAQHWEAQSMQLVEPPEQRIILVKIFPESEARIEYDLVAIDYRRTCIVRPIGELALHQQQQLICWNLRKPPPLFRL